MQKDRFSAIKNNVQEIIDFIAEKNAREASNKLVEVSEELDELLDFSEDDEDLMEISRYQVLLNQLHQKIVGLDGQVTGSI
jgi:Zn-dependent M32 family carboxypeptidase